MSNQQKAKDGIFRDESYIVRVVDGEEEIIGEVTDEGKWEMDVPLDTALLEQMHETFGEGIQPVWPAQQIPAKKGAKQAAKKGAKQAAKKGAKSSNMPEDWQIQAKKKDPGMVKFLHENDWDKFCEVYGVVQGTEKKSIEDIKFPDVKTHLDSQKANQRIRQMTSDTRYDAEVTTILTKQMKRV